MMKMLLLQVNEPHLSALAQQLWRFAGSLRALRGWTVPAIWRRHRHH
jgi:hypothetical protein